MRTHRQVIVMAVSAVFWICGLPPGPTIGGPSEKQLWQHAMKELIGTSQPREGHVAIIASNIVKLGSPLLIEVSVGSPMTTENYVKVVHLFATKGPWPHVASFYFTPMSGEASAITKIRVIETGQLVAVAQMSDGEWFMARHDIKVSAGAYSR